MSTPTSPLDPATLEVLPVPVAVLHGDGRVRAVNACFTETFGWTAAELDGKTLPSVWDEEGLSHSRPSRLRARDGEILDVVARIGAIDGGTLVAFHDITRHRRVTRELDRLSAIYSTVVNLKNALRGARTPHEVFQEVCRVVAAHSGFKLMWIGKIDRELGQIIPVARAGEVKGYVETLQIHLDREPECLGPTATSIREGSASVFNDFLQDPRAHPWHAPAREQGLRAVIALPIRIAGEVWGSFTVYAGEPGVFGEREVALLEDLALDVSLALDGIEAERQRREAEAALARREQELSTVLRSAHDGFLMMDLDGRILATNDSYCKMTGYVENEVLQRYVTDLDVHFTAAVVREIILEVTVGRQVKQFETVHQRSDGSRFDVEVTASPLLGSEGKLVAFLRDISDRKRAATELERRLELEERLSLVAASVPGAVYAFQLHPDGRVTVPYASPNCASMFAVSEEEMRHDFSRGLANLHPEDAPSVQSAIEASAASLSLFHQAFRVRHPERGLLWLEAQSVPRREPDGSTVWVGYVHDVTLQRAAEAALRDSESRLRAMADTIGEVFWMTDARMNVLFVSAGFERVWGRTAETAQRQPDAWMAYIAPDDRPVFRNAVALACAGTATDIEYRIVRPDGEIRWLHDRAYPKRDADGNVAIIYGVATDITARQQAEEQLRKLSRAVEQSASSIIITDAQARIEYVNPRFTSVTGYTAEEAIGQNPRLLQSGETPREVFQHMWAVLAKGRDWQGDFVNRRKDGRRFIEHARISPIFDERGRVTHYLSVADDVTERRDLEASLRQAQKMDAMGRLAGGIAHDFGNLLLIVDGYCKYLVEDGLPERFHEAVKQIQLAAQRASGLTRQLLAFGRRQVGSPRLLDIDEVVAGTAHMIGRLLGEGIVLEHGRCPQKATVFADAAMLDQVLLNLAINARDAMPEGGRLAISTAVVDYPPGTPHPGPWVCVRVADTGSGIPADLLPRIFEPFFTTKKKGKGTGLGLASVYGIVEQHQGWIDVESEARKGTVFRLHLPLFEHDVPALETPAPRGHGRLLLVDDEAPVRDLLTHMLVRLGYTVVEATDAEDALALWDREKGHFDALVTDIMMPTGMSGVELGRRLQDLRPGFPVLHISGYNTESEGTLVEGENFLTKPCTPSQLGRALLGLMRAKDGSPSSAPA